MNKANIFSYPAKPAGNRTTITDPSPQSDYLYVAVHPCVINNRPHIVYPRGLRDKQPGLFAKLAQYYRDKGYSLKEDQRSKQSSSYFANQRRRWMPILLFTASLLFESSAHADVEIEIENSQNLPSHQVKLHLISNKDIRHRIQQQLGEHTSASKPQAVKINSTVAKNLFLLLESRYIQKENDPDYIIEDLKQIANYYSHFPEVISLLKALKNRNWELSYDENNWVTTASGNMMEVEKAVISFNTRSAAQLRLNRSCKHNPVCIASPADALLHEFLHTHSMLANTREFLSQGGMGNVMYPYEHEYSVIDKERSLYASMSKTDHLQRPQRREHTGRLVKANCPTCIN